jgi:hypothetical protein
VTARYWVLAPAPPSRLAPRQDLAYVGKAGTGFTQKTARELRQLLQPLVINRPASTQPVRTPKAKWGEAELSAAIPSWRPAADPHRRLQQRGTCSSPRRRHEYSRTSRSRLGCGECWAFTYLVMGGSRRGAQPAGALGILALRGWAEDCACRALERAPRRGMGA